MEHRSMGFSNPKRPSMACRLVALLLLMALMAVDAQDQAAAAAAAAADPLVMIYKARMRSLLEAPKLDCGRTCWGRCGNNWKNEMCNKMCNVCCDRCNCVPPGTGQDTRHLCPCYDTMVNPHTGKLKCP